MSEPQTIAQELDEIEAQLDSTVPYYLPRLIQSFRAEIASRAASEAEIARLRSEIERLRGKEARLCEVLTILGADEHDRGPELARDRMQASGVWHERYLKSEAEATEARSARTALVEQIREEQAQHVATQERLRVAEESLACCSQRVAALAQEVSARRASERQSKRRVDA